MLGGKEIYVTSLLAAPNRPAGVDEGEADELHEKVALAALLPRLAGALWAEELVQAAGQHVRVLGGVAAGLDLAHLRAFVD